MRRAALLLALLLLPMQVTRAQAPGGKDTGGIGTRVIESWGKAGANFGWHSQNGGANASFTPKRPNGKMVVPAFGITAKTLDALKSLPEPEVPFGLAFTMLQVNDEQFKSLARFSKLHTLDLLNSNVSDANMKELAGLQQLHALHLDSTRIGDAGLKWLAGCQQLRILNLYATKISDRGLKDLAGLTQLQQLDLGDCKITDTGLKELVSLKRLETLLLDGTQVTDKGVAELQKALPKCKIDR
jgi:hypothetical protein